MHFTVHISKNPRVTVSVTTTLTERESTFTHYWDYKSLALHYGILLPQLPRQIYWDVHSCSNVAAAQLTHSAGMNHAMFGLRPLGFHLVNVLLHSCVCLLMTRLLLRLLRLPQGIVLSAGLLFATHPIHTEAVTGLVGRADVLASLFFLTAILTYHRATEEDNMDPDEAEGAGGEGGGAWESKRSFIPTGSENGWGWGGDGVGVAGGGGGDGGRRGRGYAWRAGVLAGAGTLCKEHALTTLAVCAAWDVIRHRKHVRSLVRGHPAGKHLGALLRRLLLLAAMSVGILILRLWMLGGSSPAFSDQDNPASFSPSFVTRTLTFLYLPVFNTWLLLCPWTLSHDWQMGSVALVTSPFDLRNLASVLLYGILALTLRAGLLIKGREGNSILLGLVLLIVPFLPATNLFFTVGFVVAERILYIPSLGYAVLISIGLSRLGRLRAPCLLLLLLVFSIRTVQRNRDWENRETLFVAGLRTLPHNAKMHYNYANLQKDLGNTNLAKYHYEEAIRLWPGHSSAHNNLGTLLNDTTAAETHFRLALKAHPQHSHAYFNLANLRQQQGRVGEAVALLEESLRYDATNRDAVSALAGLYGDAGRPAEAENLHLALLGARPTDPVVHNNYAAFLQRIGRREAALRHYEAALGLDPEHTVALVNTARLMRTLDHNKQAEILYKRKWGNLPISPRPASQVAVSRRTSWRSG
ncbi:protein O-mannosyl-transferase TMTC1-like [Penaeus monodon]|uniref:protein O-mannosyl-transferase TMTC1-like n=1 Tax=Penaeus monodon TaxID=6687 RepID=UPI0018A78AB0|nr:protein O-mannosyl-transferase TMTC1-like [Penaeus monodon]